MSDSEQGEYYEVKQGENLTLIAVRNGFADHKPVYDHPNNADLKRIRPSPDILHPGDQVFIPKVRLREESGATEQCHCFVVKWPKKVLRITLQDSEGKAIANAAYQLVIEPSDGINHRDRRRRKRRLTYQGETNPQGLLEQPVPINAEHATLTVAELVWHVALGYLNPLEDTPDDTVSGVQARLQNLGFYSGKIDGILGPRTKQAIRAFQRKYQPNMEPPDGICGPGTETLSILKEKHKV